MSSRLLGILLLWVVSLGCTRSPAPADVTEPEDQHPAAVSREDDSTEPIPFLEEERRAPQELWSTLSEQELERAARGLEVADTRMNALETLIRFAGPKLYEGSVTFCSGDPHADELRKRAAGVVHSCNDIETVSQALDHSSRTLRGWGTMAFRTFSYGEERDPRWVALLPKLMRFAEAPDDPGLRGYAVMRLKSYPEARDFLHRRIEIETSPMVLMRLARCIPTPVGKNRYSDLICRRLLCHGDENVRIGGLGLIAGNQRRAEMWRVPITRPVFERIIELTRSESARERVSACSALREAWEFEPDRTRRAFLRLAQDQDAGVRRLATRGLEGQLDHEDVRDAINALLKDRSPLVRVHAIRVDGASKHVGELQALAKCADEEAAKWAQLTLDRVAREEAATQDTQVP
jgi:hypothetical protein